MNKYDELFFSANELKKMTIETREQQRLSNLKWLSSHLKYQAQEGMFSTTLMQSCLFLTNEDWEQLRNKGYDVCYNHGDKTFTISWE